jgi:L-rhamnose mutarotase
MGHFCAVVEIKKNSINRYSKLHKEMHKGPYKQLLKIIKDSGVKEEVIFIFKNYAILFFEADDLNKCYSLQQDFKVYDDWHLLMMPMFEDKFNFLDSKKYDVPLLEKIFDLNEQLVQIDS